MGLKKLFVIATFLLAPSSSKANEASLLLFRPGNAVPDTAERNVSVALRTYFQTLGRMMDSFSPRSATEIPSRPLEDICSNAAYSPTWWLKPDVETRRAAHFAAMTSIACEFGLPAHLLDAVIAQESGYQPFAFSSAGAMGMMQIMPRTARSLGLSRPWDPMANMRAGARYLRQQIDRFGRVDLALAAYNAGPERPSLRGGYIPAIPETMGYVRVITTNWARLAQQVSTEPAMMARAAAANWAVRAAGYREVTLSVYDGMNALNPI